MEVVHVRMPKALVKLIDHYSVEQGIYRQAAVATLCEAGLKAIGFTWPPIPNTPKREEG